LQGISNDGKRSFRAPLFVLQFFQEPLQQFRAFLTLLIRGTEKGDAFHGKTVNSIGGTGKGRRCRGLWAALCPICAGSLSLCLLLSGFPRGGRGRRSGCHLRCFSRGWRATQRRSMLVTLIFTHILNLTRRKRLRKTGAVFTFLSFEKGGGRADFVRNSGQPNSREGSNSDRCRKGETYD